MTASQLREKAFGILRDAVLVYESEGESIRWLAIQEEAEELRLEALRLETKEKVLA